MDFLNPKTIPPIATYGVMTACGQLPNRAEVLPNVINEQILKWYENMVTGTILWLFKGTALIFHPSSNSGRHHVRSPKARPTKLLHGM